MQAVSLIVILLSNQGYWFGGREGTLTVRWAVDQDPSQAQVRWLLSAGAAPLAQGKLDLKKDDKAVPLRLQPPTVRARTALTWSYRIFDAGLKEIGRGEAVIHVFPDTLTEPWPRLVGQKKLLVWDRADGLPKLLEKAKVPHVQVEGGSGLAMAPADVILVGPGRLDNSPFTQSPLLGQAQNGASVMVFAQDQPTVLAGYAVSQRTAPARLEWRMDHPLLAGLTAGDAGSWLAAQSAGPPALLALRLPPDEPALEIAYWPREVASDKPAPIEALLLTRTVGKGRLTLCQLPLGDWQSDPRSQIFLGNAIEYLLTRPEPTPPPSQRTRSRPLDQAPQVPTVSIPPGDKP